MDRSIHFDLMRETAAEVIPILRKAYRLVAGSDRGLYSALGRFVFKRTRPGQCLLRPYLVRIGYELAGGENWLDIVPACAAVEVFNISTYQSNLCFDGKDECLTQSDRNLQIISSMLSLQLAVELIEHCTSVSPAVRLNLIGRLNQVNRDIYLGQYLDLNVLNLDNRDILHMDGNDYLAQYRLRCEKLGGSLTAFCLEIGSKLADPCNEHGESISAIGLSLGTAGQMVNDIGDYAACLTVDTSLRYAAPFSDLTHRKVTYPLFHLLSYGTSHNTSTITDFSKRDRLSEDDMRLVLVTLANSGAFVAARKEVKSIYNSLKKRVRLIPADSNRLLSLACSSLVTNKYFGALRAEGFLDGHSE